MNNQPNVKLGFIGLAAMVFAMVVGAGIFNIPQNMAYAAGPGAVILSWLITAVGMLMLVFTFKTLSDAHPELNAGIYLYARRGFGPLAGFMAAWGYWLSAAFANVAYAVMLNDAFGTFFPTLLNHGWATVLFGSLLIWAIYVIAVNGMRTAKILTTLMAAIKVSTILLIIVLMALNFRVGTFSVDFRSASGLSFWPLMDQVKSTMMVTLWCFVGIEGATIMSGRAARARDVGRASVAGFFAAWSLYVLVALLCFGCMSRAELAGLNNPSVAYVLREICGDWGFYFVIISVIISLLGGWLAWTLICGEVPYAAAEAGIFPRRFIRLNRHGMPRFGLLVSSVIMQLFLTLVAMADNVYLTALSVTGMMILPCYLLSAAYLTRTSSGRSRWLGIGCTLFCCWMIYAGGIELLMQTSLFYLLGIGFHLRARVERGEPMLTPRTAIAIALLLAAALIF